MLNRFDQLAKALGGALTRRETLKCLAGFAGGAVLTLFGKGGAVANPSRSACKARCRVLAATPGELNTCVQTCQSCTKVGQACRSGPGQFFCCSGIFSETLCCSGSSCIDDTTNSNCGACGNVCPTGTTCSNMVCTCTSPSSCSVLTSCGGTGTSCLCAATASGTNRCIQTTTVACINLRACHRDRDCGLNSVCVTGSCCTGGVCLGLCGTAAPTAAVTRARRNGRAAVVPFGGLPQRSAAARKGKVLLPTTVTPARPVINPRGPRRR